MCAAIRITSASWPNSCTAIGCASGCILRNSRCVRSSPYLRPKLDTISDTAKPAPWRLAWRRTNQLPIPASGASTTRLGSSMPARVQGVLSEGTRKSLEPALPPEVDGQEQARKEQAADPEDPEDPGRSDVPHEPGEVLAEEAGEERQRKEDR